MQTVIGQLAWRSFRRLLGLLLLIGVLLAATASVIVVQASRDDGDHADTAVLIDDGQPSEQSARIDRAFDLYQSGRIARIIVVGQHAAPTETTLLNRGVEAIKLVGVEGPTQRAQLDELRKLFGSERPSDALLIAEPVQMLRLLKMAHDRGLSLRSAPTGSASTIELHSVINEVWHYFAYLGGKD